MKKAQLIKLYEQQQKLLQVKNNYPLAMSKLWTPYCCRWDGTAQKSDRARGCGKPMQYIHADIYKCESCGMTDKWNGKPILLEIDHINGDCFDNTKDNLRFLCPNCHSQTHTHSHNGNSGRNKKYRQKPICK